MVRALSFSAVAGADAQSGSDAGGGCRLSPCRAGFRRRTDERAVSLARHRQVDRDRPAARHQGRAGRRSQDRQCGRALGAARLHHRRRGRSDQHRVLRFRGPADRGLRHRRQARPQRRARRAQADAAECRHPDRRPRRQRHPHRHGGNPDRGAAGERYRRAAGGRRRQGRQLHHGPGPRPGDAEGDGRRSRALDHQAIGHRSLRPAQLRHRGRELQQLQSVHGDRPAAGRGNAITTSFGSAPVGLGHPARDGERRRDPNAG